MLRSYRSKTLVRFKTLGRSRRSELNEFSSEGEQTKYLYPLRLRGTQLSALKTKPAIAQKNYEPHGACD